jgi:hypothetical protein
MPSPGYHLVRATDCSRRGTVPYAYCQVEYTPSTRDTIHPLPDGPQPPRTSNPSGRRSGQRKSPVWFLLPSQGWVRCRGALAVRSYIAGFVWTALSVCTKVPGPYICLGKVCAGGARTACPIHRAGLLQPAACRSPGGTGGESDQEDKAIILSLYRSIMSPKKRCLVL